MTKIVSLKKLYALRSTLYAKSKVVLATGVFDLLHQEHLNFLRAAKKIGSVLFIGLESDQRVNAIKGSSRPINKIDLRLKNISELNIADVVFELPSNLDTKKGREDLILNLKPNTLAVSDHTPNLKEKLRVMKLVNSQVSKVLAHNPKVSSTALISKKLEP